jgi:hypothetical protein
LFSSPCWIYGENFISRFVQWLFNWLLKVLIVCESITFFGILFHSSTTLCEKLYFLTFVLQFCLYNFLLWLLVVVWLKESIVRPHLEYGSSVWSVIYKKEAIQLENVQRRATKLIKNIQHKTYTQRLKHLGLPSLHYSSDSELTWLKLTKSSTILIKCNMSKFFL